MAERGGHHLAGRAIHIDEVHQAREVLQVGSGQSQGAVSQDEEVLTQFHKAKQWGQRPGLSLPQLTFQPAPRTPCPKPLYLRTQTPKVLRCKYNGSPTLAQLTQGALDAVGTWYVHILWFP